MSCKQVSAKAIEIEERKTTPDSVTKHCLKQSKRNKYLYRGDSTSTINTVQPVDSNPLEVTLRECLKPINENKDLYKQTLRRNHHIWVMQNQEAPIPNPLIQKQSLYKSSKSLFKSQSTFLDRVAKEFSPPVQRTKEGKFTFNTEAIGRKMTT